MPFDQLDSTPHADASAAWTDLVRAFLSHGRTAPDHLARVLELAPDAAMAHAAKGLFLMMLGRAELRAPATEALDRARGCLSGTVPSRRETGYVAALDAWVAGHPALAIRHMETVLADRPDDALAAKIDHGIRFILGDATGMRRMIEQVLPHHRGRLEEGYLIGCHAFALEETGDYAAAEAAGRRALELCPDDAWGLHAVAHVHDMTARPRDGLAWLDGREAAWAHCNNFRFHVWWHRALMLLDLGDLSGALELYDSAVRVERTDDYRDIANATSLLVRLELEGVDVGARWDELAALSAARTDDGCLIFADLHYLLALIGGDRAADRDRIVARIAADGTRGATGLDGLMADPGTAAATGLAAFGAGSYGAAFDHLRAARPAMRRAGGSHAQRDVFERLTIDAGLRAGRHVEAAALLDDRRARRGGFEDGFEAARRALIGSAHAAGG